MNFKNQFRRFSVYGDFWPKFMRSVARHCPWYLEPVLIWGFTFGFWLVCTPARKGVTSNLNVLFPESPYLVNLLRSFRVFWNFSWSMLDRIHVRDGKPVISWNVAGKRCLNALEGTRGAILITAHMGNYDVAAPVFAHHFDQPIHIVRAPERQKENQEFQKEQLKDGVEDRFVVHYNEPGNMLGMALAKAINDGGVVAIQGDRVLFDVTPVATEFDEKHSWRVPLGPFTLAIVSKVPLYPVFIVREGYRRYRVEAFEPFDVVIENRDKVKAQLVAAETWTRVIRPIILKYWYQWFVFEPVFQLKANYAAKEGENS